MAFEGVKKVFSKKDGLSKAQVARLQAQAAAREEEQAKQRSIAQEVQRQVQAAVAEARRDDERRRMLDERKRQEDERQAREAAEMRARMEADARAREAQERAERERRAETVRQERASAAAAQQLKEQADKAEQERRALKEAARTSEKDRVRGLREYIREKHCLDVEIWQLANGPYVDREELMKLCKRSDTLMNWICETVASWEESHFKGADEAELKLAMIIKEELGMVRRSAKSWETKPPWEYTKRIKNSYHYYDDSM